MSVNIEVKFDTKGFNKLKEIYKQTGLIAKVGILGKTNSRNDDLTNATIGAIHEYGSIDNKIPARSFLKQPIISHIKELSKVVETTLINEVNKIPTKDSIHKVLNNTAIKGVAIVQEAFETGGYGKWSALKPQTIKRKNSNAILIDTGQLRKSITFDVSKNS